MNVFAASQTNYNSHNPSKTQLLFIVMLLSQLKKNPVASLINDTSLRIRACAFLQPADHRFDFAVADKCSVAPRSVFVRTAQVQEQMVAPLSLTPANRKNCVSGKASTAFWLQVSPPVYFPPLWTRPGQHSYKKKGSQSHFCVFYEVI